MMESALSDPIAGVEEHVVATRTRGRFLLEAGTYGKGSLAVAFHGYAENARAALEELRASLRYTQTQHHLLAIEGLHAFYDRKGEKIYRSWMTRDLRLEAIADNVSYVAQVLDQVRPRVGWGCPLVFVGFSQGVAMAWRAAVRGGHGARAVAALAGDLPPELAELPLELPFPSRALLGRGSEETYYSGERLERDRSELERRGVEVTAVEFEGGHEWTDAFRVALADLLDRAVV